MRLLIGILLLSILLLMYVTSGSKSVTMAAPTVQATTWPPPPPQAKPLVLTPLVAPKVQAAPPAPVVTEALWKCANYASDTYWGTYFNLVKRDAKGNIKCHSNNHKDCVWFPSAVSCQAGLALLNENVRTDPLTCGTGGVGYMSTEWPGSSDQDTKSWCYKGRTDVGYADVGGSNVNRTNM